MAGTHAGDNCPRGIQNTARVEGLDKDVAAMTEQVHELDKRQTKTEITVAGIATRVTMWASLGVAAATIVVQVLFQLVLK